MLFSIFSPTVARGPPCDPGVGSTLLYSHWAQLSSLWFVSKKWVSHGNQAEPQFACCLGDKFGQDGPRAADETETSSRYDANVQTVLALGRVCSCGIG